MQSECEGHGTQIEFRCISWLLRAGHVAGVFRVDLESGSGSTVQERYEGRLTTARETMSTAWIERSEYTSEQPEPVSEVGEKRADCERASGELVLYGKVPWGAEFNWAWNVKNKTIAIATEACGLGLSSRCSNRNKPCQLRCVERSVHVEAIATREVGARVHGRRDTEEPLGAIRA